MSRIRPDLQIEKGLPTGNKVLAKPDGKTEVVQIEPYKVSPTTWVVDDAGIYENIPGQFEIPSLPYAKDVDTAFSIGGKVFKYNAGGGYFELVFDSVVKVIEASENDIATFATNSGNYTFNSGDFITIPDGVGGYNLFIYNGGTKTDTNSYLPLDISQIDWSQVNNTPTTLAGYGITDAATAAQGNLADSSVQSVTGAGVDNTDPKNPIITISGSGIQSVTGDGVDNTDPDNPVLSFPDADQIDDSTTTNKFITQQEKSSIASAVQPGDLADVATSGDYDDLLNKPPVPDSLDDLSGTSDDITEGFTQLFFTLAERNKLSGIDPGAEANVNADWNAVSGDAEILNKPTLGTASAADVGDFATAAQGNLADSSVQSVTGAGVDNTDPKNPVITISPNGVQSVDGGTGIDVDDTDPENPQINLNTASISSLQKADSAVQPGDLATVATSGEFGDLQNTPDFVEESERDQPGGFAGVGMDGFIPSLLLPSYVDDVLEFADFSSLPATGESGKIYITIDDNLTYRWSGSTYVEISASLALGETSSTAYRGDRGKTAYDHSQVTSGNPHNVTASDVGLGNVDNTSDADKPVSTAQGQAINQAEADAKLYTDQEIIALNLGTASQSDVGDFATAAQGAKADTALQTESDPTVPAHVKNITSQNIADWNNADPNPTDTDEVPEGTTNKYYTETRVSSNSDVAANTAARHTHSNKALLDTYNQTNADITQAISDASTAVQPGDLAPVATSGDYGDLDNKPVIPNSLDDLSGDSDDISEGATNLFMTSLERSKLTGIESGAEVNVNADWNASSGDAEILNKPTLGTAAAADVGDFATSAQGAKADTAIQPSDIDTLAELNNIITDANLDDESNPRPPTAHTHTASEITDFDTEVSNNVDVSQNTADRHTHANKAVLDNIDDTGVGDKFLSDDGTYKGVSTGSADWGSIIGTLSNQTDLQNELDGKSDVGHQHTASDITDFDTAVGNNADVAANTNARHTHANKTDLDNYDPSNFATAAQGAKADTAVQPGDLATVATTGAYSDLSGTPTLGTAAAADIGDFATAAQGSLANTALQPGSNISELNNDENYIDASGAPIQSVTGSAVDNTDPANPVINLGVGGVQSVTGDGVDNVDPENPVLSFPDADEVDDTTTTNKFVTAAEKADIASALQPGDNISQLNNNSGYVDAAGAASAAPVQSVNTQSGAVVLDADDIDDSTTVHKFVTQALINTLNSAVQPGDLATVATTGNYSDLIGAPAIPDSLDDLSGDSDDITEGTAHLFMTSAERNKLSGIASGAEVNVNADWNAVSGDAQILNKPTLGTAAAADTGDFATAAQGALAVTAVQPGDLADVATSGSYSDLTGTPSIPNSLDDLSGDSDDISEGSTNLFLTTAERSKLTGIESGAEVNVNADWNAVSGDAQILNKPTLGTAAAADTGDFATAAQGSLANTALQPGDDISELINDEGFVDAAGAAAAAPVQSVNGDTGAVTLDADDVGAIPASEKGANNGVATLDANGQLQTSQVPSYAITEIIEASETSIAAFAANSGSYDFDIGDVILIDNGGVISHYLYKGGTKTDVNEYSEISASQVDWGNVTNKPTLLYPGDNISELVNDEGFVDSAGAASAAPVQSVNGNTGAVTLDADDISDSSTTNKFVTQAEKNDIASAVQPGDLASVATSGSYNDLSNTPSIPDSLGDLSGDSDDISEGTTNLFMTPLERSKLTGIASGAEVNVNADWNAVSGDAQILNKPTLGTAAAADVGDFATAVQGTKADTALQPGDNVSDLTNDSGFVDSAGAASAAPVQSVNSQTGSVVLDADDIDDASTTNKFVTAAEKSDIASAIQPGDLATVATTGAYSDLSGTPTLGTAAAADTGDFATAAQGSLADTAVQPDLQDISGADWVLDEDDMISDSDTKVPTQQSVKAYVDANAGGDPVNLFTDDLTLTEDRSHDLDGNELELKDGVIQFANSHIVGVDTEFNISNEDQNTQISFIFNTALTLAGFVVTNKQTGNFAGFQANSNNLQIHTMQPLTIHLHNKGVVMHRVGINAEWHPFTIPEYATDTDADNDSDLAANAPYSVTGDRVVRTKSSASPFNPSYGYQTLTDAATIVWDMDLGEMAEVTLGGNRTLDNPTNLKKGTYSLLVKQDATGGRTLSYGTAFKWPNGSPPDLTSDPNSVDLLTFVSDGTNIYGAITSNYS